MFIFVDLIHIIGKKRTFFNFVNFRDKTGGITFGDFMEFLSVISKGTVRDKLMWTFTFYDVDHDGVISKEEMLKVKTVFLEICSCRIMLAKTFKAKRTTTIALIIL